VRRDGTGLLARHRLGSDIGLVLSMHVCHMDQASCPLPLLHEQSVCITYVALCCVEERRKLSDIRKGKAVVQCGFTGAEPLRTLTCVVWVASVRFTFLRDRNQLFRPARFLLVLFLSCVMC